MKVLFTLLMMLAFQAVIGQTDSVKITSKPVNEYYDKGFSRLEKGAKFPGGAGAWAKYLERNLDPFAAVNDGAPKGKYIVKLQFLVDQEGNISDVKAIDVPKKCPTCSVEAIKVIKKSPRWEPAIQNGRPVKYLQTQTINFAVMED